MVDAVRRFSKRPGNRVYRNLGAMVFASFYVQGCAAFWS